VLDRDARDQIVTDVSTPVVWRCGHYKKRGAAKAANTASICPLVTRGDGNLLLLWGVDVDGDPTDTALTDDDGYSETPLAAAYALLEKVFKRDLDSIKEQHSDYCEDAWWRGGAMPSHLLQAKSQKIDQYMYANVAQKLSRKKRLQFVYDLTHTEAPFDSLLFVRDAGRPPLKDLAEHRFREEYGVNRRLAFSPRPPRPAYSIDWFSCY